MRRHRLAALVVALHVAMALALILPWPRVWAPELAALGLPQPFLWVLAQLALGFTSVLVLFLVDSSHGDSPSEGES